MNPFRKVGKFHEKFELGYDGVPRQLDRDFFLFRVGFMAEELGEYAFDHPGVRQSFVEMAKRNAVMRPLEHQFDALIDLSYVTLGTAYLQGFDFNEGFRRVHRANMAKERCRFVAESTRGSTSDVIKPAGWVPPDLSDLV